MADCKRIHCNRCKDETNHTLRARHPRRWVEQPSGFWEEATYSFWTCAGCDAGTMETAYTNASMEDEDGRPVYDYSYAPERSLDELPRKVFSKLPKQLTTIHQEAVDAYNHRLPVLCAVGLRALIEGICKEKGIKGKNLEEKIDGLRAVLPENIVRHLHGFRFMGNEAAHELAPPDRETLRLAIEVSEDLLNFLYELDYKASRLPKKGSTPSPDGA